MLIELNKASDRNTQSHWVRIGQLSILFSYETAVAYRLHGNCPDNLLYPSARRANIWGPTTGRHIKEAGVVDYPMVTPEGFEKALDTALVYAIASRAKA